jgi:hypothetical protein
MPKDEKPARTEQELGTHGDQDIVKGPPASEDARFVRIGEADDPFTADLLADALAEEDIPVLARASRDQLMDMLVDPSPAAWEILVPASVAERATALLRTRQAELDAEDMASAAEDEEREGEV